MLTLRAPSGFPTGLWDGKLSLLFTDMQWGATEKTNRQKYKRERDQKKTEHWDRPESAKWTHSETIKSCVETREANTKTEKGEEEDEERGESDICLSRNPYVR